MANPIPSLFKILSSLKAAVVTLLAIAGTLATGTVIEAIYDTSTAQHWVYRSKSFALLLALLFVEVLLVALSRLPWKRRHLPFLTAHLGILLLLTGAAISASLGFQGRMRIYSGRSSQVVLLDEHDLTVSVDPQHSWVIQEPWAPPGVKISPVPLAGFGVPSDLVIDDLLLHSTHEAEYLSAEPNEEGSAPAIRLELTGGAMKFQKSYWLWSGLPLYGAVRAGPALLSLGKIEEFTPGPWLSVESVGTGGEVLVTTRSLEGAWKRFSFSSGLEGASLDPGWAEGVRIKVTQWLPRARQHWRYQSTNGERGGTAALHLTSARDPRQEFWVEFGSPAHRQLGGHSFNFMYGPKEYLLPFSIHLDQFEIDRYAGTGDPMEFRSRVHVLADGASPQSVAVSMNEPLKFGGLRFFQASFEGSENRAPTAVNGRSHPAADPTQVTSASIFSVNHDPGRILKYLGGLLIALGAISLFAQRRGSLR